jgi:hypothetical protein
VLLAGGGIVGAVALRMAHAPAAALTSAVAAPAAPSVAAVATPAAPAAVAPQVEPASAGSAVAPLVEPAHSDGKTQAAARARAAHPTAAVVSRPAERPAPALGKSDSPVAPKPVAKAQGDELDQLLATSAPQSSPKAQLTPAEEGLLPEAPSRESITQAMGAIKPRIQACYEKFQQTGIVNLQVTIAKTGRVTAASATGKFAGSDTGKCAASAVKSAVFPRFRTAQLKIDYPFMLTPQ